MTWLAVVTALLLLHFFPFSGAAKVQAAYRQLAEAIEANFDAGDAHSGAAAYVLLAMAVLVPTALLYFLLATVLPILAWAANVGALYVSITFWSHLEPFVAIRTALQEGDAETANAALAKWSGDEIVPDSNQIARLGVEALISRTHYGLFGSLFWFCVVPGPLGLVLYQATYAAQCAWRHDGKKQNPDEQLDFAGLARNMWEVMDWLPRRMTALTFAVVGNFEDALFCWRDQAEAWINPDEGLVLASAAGAMGARLGGTVLSPHRSITRPELGLGENADASSMASAEGLVWRGLVLWVALLVLLGIASAL